MANEVILIVAVSDASNFDMLWYRLGADNKLVSILSNSLFPYLFFGQTTFTRFGSNVSKYLIMVQIKIHAQALNLFKTTHISLLWFN